MEKKEAVQQKTHKIRITLTSLDVPKIEKVSAELVKNAKDKSLDVSGPKRMPTKVMRITTRRTPCGEGSKTWDRFQMRIHKRVIDFEAPSNEVKEITKISVPSGVEVEVTVLSN